MCFSDVDEAKVDSILKLQLQVVKARNQTPNWGSAITTGNQTDRLDATVNKMIERSLIQAVQVQ